MPEAGGAHSGVPKEVAVKIGMHQYKKEGHWTSCDYVTCLRHGGATVCPRCIRKKQGGGGPGRVEIKRHARGMRLNRGPPE